MSLVQAQLPPPLNQQPTPAALPEEQPLSSPTQPVSPSPVEQSSTPTEQAPVAEPAPLPQNPLESSSSEPRPERPKRSSATGKSDIASRLDRLMENAVDELPVEQAPPPPPQKETPSQPEPKVAEASQAEQMKKAQEDFYKDPLIQDALKIFEGSFVK